jgi:hypothetical protein|tara:strand:- start:682 stop:873 length:192 start_codon:yes stop_codon:yes gene_type:complete
MPQPVNQNRLIKLEQEHRTLDTEIKRLYNTTNSEKTLKELKVKKLKLKDKITKLQGVNDGKEN